MSEGLIIGILVCFGDIDFGYFYTLKVLVDVLVLSLDKNVSIYDTKSA